VTARRRYRDFCTTEKNIPIFSKDWWLDSVCGYDNWDVVLVEKGGHVFASMPYQMTTQSGVVSIHIPKLTQTLGIYFKYPENQKYFRKLSFEKEMIDKVLKQLPKFDSFYQSFNYSHTNLLPFHWAGFDTVVRYTYVIDGISIEELENQLETDIRRRRRKASSVGVDVVESEDVRSFYQLNEGTFRRQKRVIPYSFEFIENLYNKCKEHGACKIIFAKDSDGAVIAGNFLIYDENTVYYLMGGMDPDKKDLGGMDVVQYAGIKFALESGRKFDFEGSMVESIEKYFRSFGAIQKPYFSVSKNNSKLLKVKRFLVEILK
jgi:hypothetical protein